MCKGLVNVWPLSCSILLKGCTQGGLVSGVRAGQEQGESLSACPSGVAEIPAPGDSKHCWVAVAAHRIMSSMKPMALAAREPRGPALMVLTRTWYFRPASYASMRVSLSSAAFALLMPPP